MQKAATTGFVTTTQEYLNNLARRISIIDPLAAQRLKMLSEAVASSPSSPNPALPSVTSWDPGAVREIIDIDTITEQARGQGNRRVIGALEWLRNGLIIFPLALTCFGISQAVSHYHTLLQSDAQLSTRPFIFLWEQGFNGTLPSFLTLSNLALGDFFLLGFILLLTFVVSWQQSITKNHKEQYVARLRSELADGLARASLCLAEKKLSQPTDFASIVMRLDHVTQKTATSLDKVTQQIGTVVHEFLTELQEERQQRGNLNIVLNKMLTDQQGFQRALYDMLSQSLGQLLAQQGQSSQELVDAVDTLNSSQLQMVQLIQQIQTVTAQQQQLIQAIENNHRAQANTMQHISTISNDMRETLKAAEAFTPELRSVAVDMTKFVSALRSIPTDLKTELFVPLKLYSSAADNIVKGADRMANAATIMQQAGEELQSAAVRLQGSSNGQQL